MANITPEEVARVGLLARLRLTDEEIREYTPQIDAILGYFQQLQKLDTSEVPATSHAIAMTNVLRARWPSI